MGSVARKPSMATVSVPTVIHSTIAVEIMRISVGLSHHYSHITLEILLVNHFF